ncbi:MAG TPA: 2-succinyl-5-enolpyruvyl-6-hydroxy-3-cyclohexene-1-carboxylic-acid synthase, partial [Polyangiaceae bacterium]|nr:2-succinyl-5-enolpyruvyl-6-hydroxy-3-cyclohexene-1-carboxylic-acid synthase [Polyangiaceae bacterium]
SGTPLIVISADRPYELQSCGAAQTFDQVKLFGSLVRSFTDLGLPDESEAALYGLRRSMAQAVHAARFPLPGPVHVNARARKPLEPCAPESADELELADRVRRIAKSQPLAAEGPSVLPAPRVLDAVASACRGTERGFIVCGPLPLNDANASVDPAALLELAKLTGFPILSETASQVRFASEPDPALCDGFDWLCRSASVLSQARPELILQFGRPPTSSAYEQFLLTCPEATRFVFAPYDWPDPSGQASAIVRGGTGAAVASLCARFREQPRAPNRWSEFWARANRIVWQAVDEELGRDAELTEAVAVREVVGSLAIGSVLCLGNSLPIRELDWFCQGEKRALRVCTQRGLNGIDGLVSGAAGVASAADRETTLLVGDVSFLHDVGGLYAARELERPLTLVVLNNDGGRIFEQLPILRGSGPSAPDPRAWLTPHGLPLEHASQLYGIQHTQVSTLTELRAALRRQATGTRVIEVRVSGRSTTALLDAITERLQARLGNSGPDSPPR